MRFYGEKRRVAPGAAATFLLTSGLTDTVRPNPDFLLGESIPHLMYREERQGVTRGCRRLSPLSATASLPAAPAMGGQEGFGPASFPPSAPGNVHHRSRKCPRSPEASRHLLPPVALCPDVFQGGAHPTQRLLKAPPLPAAQPAVHLPY